MRSKIREMLRSSKKRRGKERETEMMRIWNQSPSIQNKKKTKRKRNLRVMNLASGQM
mgnify:CR=1 FL=1